MRVSRGDPSQDCADRAHVAPCPLLRVCFSLQQDEPLPGMDSIVSPWRRPHIMPGAISDIDYIKSDVIQIMLEPPPFSSTTVVDNHGSVYAPAGGAGGRGGCSSLDGPHCMRIKEQYAELSDEELAGIEECVASRALFETACGHACSARAALVVQLLDDEPSAGAACKPCVHLIACHRTRAQDARRNDGRA